MSLEAQQHGLSISIDAPGHYSVSAPGAGAPVLVSEVAAKIAGQWVRSDDYPYHAIDKTTVGGYLGTAEQWRVVFSGLAGKPDLVYKLCAYQSQPFADLQLTVKNSTSGSVDVQSIRVVEASGEGIAALGGPAAANRVLSDSFSEDRPVTQIHDLVDAKDQMHRAVGSQLIYNRDSHRSLFLGNANQYYIFRQMRDVLQ